MTVVQQPGSATRRALGWPVLVLAVVLCSLLEFMSLGIGHQVFLLVDLGGFAFLLARLVRRWNEASRTGEVISPMRDLLLGLFLPLFFMILLPFAALVALLAIGWLKLGF